MTRLIFFLIILCFEYLYTQNTSSISGNWDECATWNTTTQIYNGSTNAVEDSKTISTNNTVIVNGDYYASDINFNPDGAITLSSQAQGINFSGDGIDLGCFHLTCSSITFSPSCVGQNTSYTGTLTIPYTDGRGQAYSAQTITSTGVTGLTATLAAGNLNTGSGDLVYNISGMTTTTGNGTFTINILGETCIFNFTSNLNSALPITFNQTAQTFNTCTGNGAGESISTAWVNTGSIIDVGCTKNLRINVSGVVLNGKGTWNQLGTLQKLFDARVSFRLVETTTNAIIGMGTVTNFGNCPASNLPSQPTFPHTRTLSGSASYVAVPPGNYRLEVRYGASFWLCGHSGGAQWGVCIDTVNSGGSISIIN